MPIQMNGFISNYHNSLNDYFLLKNHHQKKGLEITSSHVDALTYDCNDL